MIAAIVVVSLVVILGLGWALWSQLLSGVTPPTDGDL